jgi:hypothetical protein
MGVGLRHGSHILSGADRMSAGAPVRRPSRRGTVRTGEEKSPVDDIPRRPAPGLRHDRGYVGHAQGEL